MPEKLMTDVIFEQVDRRVYGGSRTIRMIERTLGIQNDSGHTYNRAGTLNTGLGEGIRTSYGQNQGQAHLYNFNAFFNNNRAVEAMPTQFKRWHLQGNHSQQQQQQQYYPQQGNPQGGQLNMPPPGAQGGNPNMPPVNPLNPMNQMSYNPMGPMDGQGGSAPYNPNFQQGPPGNQGPQGQGGYYNQQQQQHGGHLNRFQGQGQGPQQYDLLNKRDKPYQQRSPDDRYGDQTRKQQHYNK